MPLSNPSFQAQGNVSPARFVVGYPTTTTGFVVQQASGTTTEFVGISAQWDRYAAGTPFDAGFIATQGQGFTVYQDGETCMIESGGSVNSFDMLTSDGSGRGITASVGNYYGAQALEAGPTLGQRIRVKVVRGKF